MNSDFATTAQQLLEGYSVLETNHLYEHGNDKDKLLAQLVAAHEADKREAVRAELQSVWDEGYDRWNNAPQSDKHSQTQHVSKALYDRLAALAGSDKPINGDSNDTE